MQNIQFAFVNFDLEYDLGVVYATVIESLEQVRYAMQKYGIDTVRYGMRQSYNSKR